MSIMEKMTSIIEKVRQTTTYMQGRGEVECDKRDYDNNNQGREGEKRRRRQRK